ncbi:pentatricopeptide repeat-containing protein At4g18520, chloroplastic-like isoform X2 [Selaginella moellendorffii]|uniref:pentatricopeptide repeat-containing protein At4g18520, chloroplastic-like isoform X2 n=1 Tax=Selaginella moellendorffii TaxID=88036 RepID=UPI000D1D09DC|nr:pentatricopeptide repeat-containing protein At4g18520, chloroplastic-like isoform X2 [Selaginella moellendorffii]|eukprot:XP_024516966.1 pentatricopeptide repeat-containing protein At4g18520, chloroplastic-like isoform X2 [Selaginella moellendorffii]
MVLSFASNVPNSMIFRAVSTSSSFSGSEKDDKHSDARTYAKLLSSCNSLKDGKSLHEAIVKEKLDRDVYLRKLLVKMYLNNGSAQHAWEVFKEIQPSVDVIPWTTIIGAFNREKLHAKALGVFRCMLLQGLKPDAVAFLPVLEACAALERLKDGLLLHGYVLEAGLVVDSVLGNSIINLYGKCGSFSEAQEVFDRMPHKNVISWTSLVAAYGRNGLPDRALELFHLMQLQGVRPSRISFVTVLNSCESSLSIEEARKIHSCIKESGCELQIIVGNALVNMYAKCGVPEHAFQVFHRMAERDVVTWTALISAWALQGKTMETSLLVREMLLHGVTPNHVTFVTVLNACEKPSSLAFGKKIHALAVEAGYEPELIVGNATVNMYGKCGSLEDAYAVFDRMPARDVITWNAIISAYAHRAHHREPLVLFERMEAEDVTPNKVTFVTVLYACAKLKALEEGRAIHARVSEAGLASEVIVGTALVNLYAKCGWLDEAREIFDTMRREDVISWNSIIGPYAESGMIAQAMELLEKMECEGILADEVTYISILNALSSPEWLEQGRLLHRLIAKRKLGLKATTETALLNMYVRCGSVEDAEKVFNAMDRHDVVSWTSMILGYYQAEQHSKALRAYKRMQQNGVLPDKAALVTIFKVCSSPELISEGRMIHASLRGNELDNDTEVGNAAINMYGRSHCCDAARETFDSMPRRDSATWGSILTTFSQHDEHGKVMELFELGERRGEAPVHTKAGCLSVIRACGNLGALARGRKIHSQIEDAAAGSLKSCGIVGSALVDMYGRCGSVEEARSVLDGLSSSRDMVLWTSMMVAYARNAQGWKALEIFWLLQQEGLIPDDVVFVALLSACSSVGAIDEALEFFACMTLDYGLEAGKHHLGCVIDLLGRTGRLAEAEETMKAAKKFSDKEDDPVMWMSILGGCSIHQEVERGCRAMKKIFGREDQAAALVMLSNMHRV